MKKRQIFLICFLSCFVFSAAQEADSLVFQIEDALEQDFYEEAMDLIKQGESLYTDDIRFPLMLGRLLKEKGLYRGALAALERAEGIDRNNGEVLNELVLVHGYRDENEKTLPYLLRLMELPEFREDAVEDLAWIYYKLHQLAQGEELLLKELEKGFNRTMTHTLGTIYAGLYRYDQSRNYYLQSIDDALKKDDSYFAAIAYYNLSILEYQYYHFEESFRLTGLSLEQRDRASGHSARGELFQLQGNFQGALKEYLLADQLTDNPLARMNLARLHWEWGRLEEAKEYADSVRDWEDPSWMYYFGIDRDEMDRDLAEVYSEIYQGLAARERALPWMGISGLLNRWIQRLTYTLQYRFHNSTYRRLCQRLGKEQLDQGNSVRGWWILSQGSRGYGKTSLYYLERSREQEVSSVPEAAPWYLLFQGEEDLNESQLIQAREELDPLWEASARQKALEALIEARGGRRRGSRDLRQQMFLENPGILLRRGWTIPLSLDVRGAEKSKKLRRKLEGYLRRSGYSLEEEAPYRLSLIFTESRCNWLLLDRENRGIRSGQVNLSGKSPEDPASPAEADLSELLRKILPELYRAGEESS